MFRLFVSALVAAVLLSGCAASSKTFYASPKKVGDTKLCRTFMKASNKGEQQFANDTASEAQRRGLTWDQCQQKVMAEDAAIVGIAVIATGVTVAAACQNGCSGGGYSPGYYGNGGGDVDCWGGGGDGPRRCPIGNERIHVFKLPLCLSSVADF